MPHRTLPAFPSDVPVAQLQKLSLSKLVANDQEESEALFNSCRSTGFFLLDLSDDQMGRILSASAASVFDLARDTFALDADEKAKYASKLGGPIFGYKGYGVGKVDAAGTPDRNELFNVSRDDILGVTSLPRAAPAPIEEKRHVLKAYMKQGHAVVQLILRHLDEQLGLPAGTLENRHRINVPSGSQTRMLRYEPQPEEDRRTSMIPHTDIGSVTLLFNELGGLQVLLPGLESTDENWMYVKPQEGCAIVNMGDAMVEWTGGVLRSNLHRVTYAPGEQSKHTRYSITYTARPERDVKMCVIPEMTETGNEQNEGVVTAEEWEKKKALGIRNGTDIAKSRGGKDFIRKPIRAISSKV